MANIFDTAASQKAMAEQAKLTAQQMGVLTGQINAAKSASVSFADATGRGVITLENFGRVTSNATKKVLVWQLAIMAVYGVIRKIQETIQVWRDLEVTLARISITTGKVGDELYDYFQRVADVAIEFGVPIEQTLVGMDLALRATARYTEGVDRAAVATQLLRDASVLANITGMQYSQSIDILVGSLRQSGMEMNEGINLLDKWVAVAKNAAVSVNDLSQGFAIMADAARAAGLTVDQVNGLIAALSETVTLGPVQVGNAIRALMSTLYNPGSISLLQKYGVAVRDASGEVRSFWDVMTQLSAMRTAGVLDDAVWLEIAKAAGAGQRRYAQFMALLNNFNTAMRVSQISSMAQGEALDANAKIVNTLTNSFDKFTASQRKFIFAIGDQAGIIDDLSGALNTLTGIFNTLSNAAPGLFTLGRAVMYLVGTLGALALAGKALGWMGLTTGGLFAMGVGPRLGGMLGRFGGVARYQVAGTGAAAAAAQAGVAGAGMVGAGAAARAGLIGLGGLIPGLSPYLARRWGMGGVPGLTYNAATQRWMGYGAGGRYGFVPTPTVGGAGVRPMTWGGIGRGLTRPMGMGGALMGGLGLGAAAWGVTGEPITGAATAIAATIGGVLGGPVGMAAGAVIGGVVGQMAADAFMSETDRIRGMWKDIATSFGIDVAEVIGREIEVITPEDEEMARKLGEAAAPKFPASMYAASRPLYERLAGGVGFGGPVSPVTTTGFAPFGRPGEEEWKTGLGALSALNQAMSEGVITSKEYWEYREKDRIAWEKIPDSVKNYMVAVELARLGDEQYRLEADRIVEAIQKRIAIQEKLADIVNKYADDQDRIKAIMESVTDATGALTLKEYENAQWADLLSRQARMSAEDFQRESDAIVGLSYGYAAHQVAIQRVKDEYGELAENIQALPLEKYIELQKWNPSLSEDIGATVQTLISLRSEIDKFYIDTADAIATAFSDITEVTSDNLTEILTILTDAIPTATEEDAEKFEEWYNKVVEIIGAEEEVVNLLKLAEGYTSRGAGYQYRGQIRVIGTEELERYREEMGRLPQFRALAESLGEFGMSVLTLVDPLTGQIQTLEENTLALQFLQRAVSDNTDAVSRLEAEYNLPGWYQRPTRYWAMKTTGVQEGFGPAQEGLWQTWMEFLQQNRSYQHGGVVSETGPYLLHRKEVILSEEGLSSTNFILENTNRAILSSNQYLMSINMGIAALRQEIASLKATGGVAKVEKESEFSTISRTGYKGLSSLGVRSY